VVFVDEVEHLLAQPAGAARLDVDPAVVMGRLGDHETSVLDLRQDPTSDVVRVVLSHQICFVAEILARRLDGVEGERGRRPDRAT
jgi:hypothetical protein